MSLRTILLLLAAIVILTVVPGRMQRTIVQDRDVLTVAALGLFRWRLALVFSSTTTCRSASYRASGLRSKRIHHPSLAARRHLCIKPEGPHKLLSSEN